MFDKADPRVPQLDSHGWRTAKNTFANPCEICPKSFSLKTKNTGDGENAKIQALMTSWEVGHSRSPVLSRFGGHLLVQYVLTRKKHSSQSVSEPQWRVLDTSNSDFRKRRGQFDGIEMW